MSTLDDRLCFVVEWYDANAALTRQYQLMYFPHDSTVEMYDIKNHRTFLRRCKVDGLGLSSLFIGSTVNVLNRQLKFVDYGDDYTRKKMGTRKGRTLGMIKPDAVAKMGPIFEMICSNGFLINQMKMCRLSRNEAMDFYREHQSKFFFNDLINFITSGPVVVFELMGGDAVMKWREVLGPTDSATARSQAPVSLRAKFGADNTKNAAHGSDSLESAARELEFFFPSAGPSRQNTATFTDCTCCVIKPHAVSNGQAGAIINKILESGFNVSAIQMFHMEFANAEEFLEVYKGVVAEYPSMVNELTSGPCIAMEIRAQDAPKTFREFTGPADPEIARHLRPRTLRALYGKDKIQNAVHCSDLPEDGILEVEYFFKILDH